MNYLSGFDIYSLDSDLRMQNVFFVPTTTLLENLQGKYSCYMISISVYMCITLVSPYKLDS